MGRLPFVDEHSRRVEASPLEAWQAVRVVCAGAFGGGARTIGRVLGVRPAGPSGPRPLALGSEVTGFAVTEAGEGKSLVLDGRHRFSRYRLAFTVEPDGDGALVRARTEAEFPGIHGRAYRALVIGTRGHVLAVRRMLRAVARRAEAQGSRSSTERTLSSSV